MLSPSFCQSSLFSLMLIPATAVTEKKNPFCFWTASAHVSTPPPPNTESLWMPLREGRLGEGAVRHFSIIADTNRKLILFCARWGVRGSGGRWVQKKIYIHSRTRHQPKGALITGFTQSFICRFKQACRRCECVEAHSTFLSCTCQFGIRALCSKSSPFLGLVEASLRGTVTHQTFASSVGIWFFFFLRNCIKLLNLADASCGTPSAMKSWWLVISRRAAGRLD